jgi:hypothetical protein
MRSWSILAGRDGWGLGTSLLAIAAACSTRSGPPLAEPPPDWSTGGTAILVTGGTGGKGGTGGTGGKGGGKGRPILDERPVVTAAATPPPISGGTLLVLKEGGRAVVADSDRDTVSVVDLVSRTVEISFPLDAKTEPGRLVEDAGGRVHVALRNTGELLTIDTRDNAAVDRRPVCRAPRGVAYDAATDRVLVACQEGALVELPAGPGGVLRTTQIAQDLRDVVFADGQLVVTRFRAAELIYLDANRNVTTRVTPAADALGFTASVAYRAVGTPEGGVVVTHQRAFSGTIDVGIGGSAGANPGFAGNGFDAGGDGGFEDPSMSGYGRPQEPCSSVVTSTVTFASAEGTLRSLPRLDRMVLPVDVAVMNGMIAVANGGLSDMTFGTAIGIYREAGLAASPEGCTSSEFFAAPGQIVSVAFDPASGALVAQSREPAQLFVVNDLEMPDDGVIIPLGSASVFDTGHEIFHADSGGGIACASCHPEGAEDGNVWRFEGFGARRTQPLDVGLEGTAPFHWEGDLQTFSDLMIDVFQNRMAGPLESPEREIALENYVYKLPRRAAVRDAADAAALRGKALFESKDVGCTECHSGPRFTNGANENIGREVSLQVPSLIAVSSRAPYMHDGCAATLLDRFDPACGGSRHGHVEGLEASDLDDLVAYLQTL